MTQADKRPDLPDPLMREVRQRCGFGCVICGLPLYEYDHIIGWAATERHVASEITLLCDKHHKEKTNGLLPQETLLAANAAPHNLRTGVTPPYYLHFSATQSTVLLGGNVFRTAYSGDGTQVVPISIDDIPLIRFHFEDGRLLLDLQVFDEFNHIILKVKDNELQYVPQPWDIEFAGRHLIVREASRKILVDIEFAPPSQIVISRARLLLNGVEVLVRPTEIKVPRGKNSLAFSGIMQLTKGGGLVIGRQLIDIGSAIRISQVPRYAKANTDSASWQSEVFTNPKTADGAP